MEEVYGLYCSNGNDRAKVPFCCVQVVPGNLNVDKNKLEKNDIELTFTPKLECCVDEEIVQCNVNGSICEIEAEVLRLVGCIEYALSTKDKSDPISGDFGAEFVAACCSSCVCVNEAICCTEDGL